jgi:hypothetical protein
MGASRNAEWFLNQARRLSPGNILPLFALVENSLKANDPGKATRYIQDMLSFHSIKEIQERLESYPNRRDMPPISYELISKAVNRRQS